MKRSAIVILALTMLAVTVAGCNKFTRARYETIYVGQPADIVEKTLGKPYAKFSDSWSYINKKPFYKAVIKFENGRVSDKAWYDEREMGDHPDSKLPSGELKTERRTTIVVE